MKCLVWTNKNVLVWLDLIKIQCLKVLQFGMCPHHLSFQSLGTTEKNTGMGSFNCHLLSQGKTEFPWSENPNCCCVPFTGTQWEFGSMLTCVSVLNWWILPFPEFTDSLWTLKGFWVLVKRQLTYQVFPSCFYSFWKAFYSSVITVKTNGFVAYLNNTGPSRKSSYICQEV